VEVEILKIQGFCPSKSIVYSNLAAGLAADLPSITNSYTGIKTFDWLLPTLNRINLSDVADGMAFKAFILVMITGFDCCWLF